MTALTMIITTTSTNCCVCRLCKSLEVPPVWCFFTCVAPRVENLVTKTVEGNVGCKPVPFAHHKVPHSFCFRFAESIWSMVGVEAGKGGGRSWIKDVHSLGPFETKISI